ncbi:MAG: glucuronate isomerase [Lacrimispora saccharolytica]
MKNFMDSDFLLQTDTAKMLYHDAAETMSIFDYHNHLNQKAILEDSQMDNLTQVWLGGDHYKWRAMRAMGVPEELITGNGSDYDKFLAWARTIENSIGNPLYHWTHLELQRYFGITAPLSEATAKQIWDSANEQMRSKEFSVRNLILRQNVKYMCTTDDPADDLEAHKALKNENFGCTVLPTFRPEKAMAIEKPGYADYIAKLSEVSGVDIKNVDDLMKALEKRMDYFISVGCVVTDHSLEGCFYQPATVEDVDRVMKKRLEGEELTAAECGMYKGYVMIALGKMYARKNIVMQLHIGALRNNSSRQLAAIGVDSGFDSMDDIKYASYLSTMLNEMDKENLLPKTVLYSLNPNDNEMLASMAGNFQGGGIRGKMQFGTAWWFNDHKPGMEAQLTVLSSIGLLSPFIGMLTDSRSFLSFPRHEYFRRILCNVVGNWVENGEYPNHPDFLKEMINNISYNNAYNYFFTK